MILPPAPADLGAVHLLSWSAGIPRRDDGVVLINDDSPEIAPEACSLVSTAQCEVEEVLVPVGPHSLKRIRKNRY